MAELQRILNLSLNAKQRFLIERELKFLRSGEQGEQNSAYYIDFRHKKTKNTVVIHDLRIQHLGAVAQIDHILINRILDIYVLESKNYYYGIKITDNGEFMVWTGKAFQGIESPIEQNKRHIELLQKTIEDLFLAPKRLGISLSPTFKNFVLVSPTARIDRPAAARFNTEAVIKADALMDAIDREVDRRSQFEMVNVVKLVSRETMEEFGQKIVQLHRPGQIDYATKFSISIEALTPAAESKTQVKPIPPATITKAEPRAYEKSCEECGEPVDNKVVYFCRINKKKFNNKILCRECQKGHHY